MKKYIILTTLVCVLYGCSLFEQKRHSGVVAEYKGKTLTYEEVQRQTIGMSTEDSARVAEQYIYQWAINLLEYDVAKDKLNKDIERMVEDYRRSLYIHEYEQYLIAQRMSKEVEDTIIKEFYDLHSHHFVLREAIVKGVLLVVPNGAPNMDLLRKNIQHPEEEENIEWIEKFAYQYAAGYELFLDDWKTVSQIILRMPFEKDDLNKQLKATRQIELQDSINTYLLQVTDLYQANQPMPIEYARPEIEKIMLAQRQVNFIQQERIGLYEKAIKEGILKRYEE
ncbi:MAG: hypothetical protein IJV81_04965 [Paludibacteraceae bacterium]|nr:hypothetical protein [Paludibacteraceae bacterium]